jgi:hypothetical protein
MVLPLWSNPNTLLVVHRVCHWPLPANAEALLCFYWHHMKELVSTDLVCLYRVCVCVCVVASTVWCLLGSVVESSRGSGHTTLVVVVVVFILWTTVKTVSLSFSASPEHVL